MPEHVLPTALQGLRRGLTPVPLRPQTKRPAVENWTSLRYDGEGGLTQIFRSITDQPVNLGLALGAKHGGLVDIDIDNPRLLAIAANILPNTPMRTGRPGNPGSHFWYIVEDYDPGIVQCKLPDRSTTIEYRGGGGQTAIPPSLHPDGDTYEWYGEAWGGEDGPTRLTGQQGKSLHALVLTLGMLAALADNWPRKGGRHAAYLPLVGGLLRDADAAGAPRLHPLWNANIEGVIQGLVDLTHDVDGPRARIAEAVHSTRRKILEGDRVQGWPTLAGIIGEEHVKVVRSLVEQIETLDGSPRGKIRRDDEVWEPAEGDVLMRQAEREDETPEERHLRLNLLDPSERDPLGERQNEWEPVDLRPYLEGGVKPPEPGLFYRSDGIGLIYPGRVNSFYGPSGYGKTLLALHFTVQTMLDGARVMFVDLEDEPHGTLDRLLDAGATPDLLLERFTYLRPEMEPLSGMQVDRYGNPTSTPTGRRSTEVLARALDQTHPDLIIIDGTTTLYRIHGHDTNAAVGTDVIAGWLRRLLDNGRRTVLLIDHTGKTASPGSTPMGSQHKVSMVQGTALHVHSVDKPRRGVMTTGGLYIGKDRPGKVAEHSIDREALLVADLNFDSRGEHLVIGIDPPDPSVVNVDLSESAQAAILTLLESTGVWMTRKEILMGIGKQNMGDRSFRTQVRALLDSEVIEATGTTKNRSYRARNFKE